jgi:hypothetical protein
LHESKEQTLSAYQQTVYEELMYKAGYDRLADVIEPGPDCLSGSQLPSHSDVNISCLDGQRILVISLPCIEKWRMMLGLLSTIHFVSNSGE